MRSALGVAAALATMLVLLTGPRPGAQSGDMVNVWLTTPDQVNLLSLQAPVWFEPDGDPDPLTIDIDEGVVYQKMDGFGASFTDASAWLVATVLPPAVRRRLMVSLFDPNDGIGLSYLRQPIGATDFALSSYTYDDMPEGATDFDLTHFSIAHDQPYILPVVQEALEINPAIRVMAVPWSAPAWMKSNGSLNGGTLNGDAATITTYADYFVKFIQQYTAAGVPIHRVAPQNEPVYTSPTYPTMAMDANQQATFIADYLGPALAEAGLATEIATYDHNWDNVAYPDSVLQSAARPYVSGSAWHCYGGSPSAMTVMHGLHPNKDIYFTECTAGAWSPSFAASLAWDLENLIIGAPLNWARMITKWNIALDTRHGPQNGGCSKCTGLVTIDDTVTPAVVTFNYDYYTLGHISKFVKPGAYRIAATTYGPGSLEAVAFVNPDGSRAVIVLNADGVPQTFTIREGSESFRYSLGAGAAATFNWRPVPTGINLLQNPGFEKYAPPAMGLPGWAADPARQTPAFAEATHPRSGLNNGACWTPTPLDCGLYQDVTAPSSGIYRLELYANADRAGGLIGANVNGTVVAGTEVAVRSFDRYGSPYDMTFVASAGDTIRVWMYSPATPGYVVVDDVVLSRW